MIGSQNFWVGAVVGVVGYHVYMKYKGKKGTA